MIVKTRLCHEITLVCLLFVCLEDCFEKNCHVASI
jgi:hypothetical protein